MCIYINTWYIYIYILVCTVYMYGKYILWNQHLGNARKNILIPWAARIDPMSHCVASSRHWPCKCKCEYTYYYTYIYIYIKGLTPGRRRPHVKGQVLDCVLLHAAVGFNAIRPSLRLSEKLQCRHQWRINTYMTGQLGRLEKVGQGGPCRTKSAKRQTWPGSLE